jgi:hypothetical protein
MIATILTAVALVASLGFNYLQYRWRKEQREEHEREKAEAKAEQLRKRRYDERPARDCIEELESGTLRALHPSAHCSDAVG